jgi:hypothetical protein
MDFCLGQGGIKAIRNLAYRPQCFSHAGEPNDFLPPARNPNLTDVSMLFVDLAQYDRTI